MSDDTPRRPEPAEGRKRPSGLGRGLSSLLGEVAQETPVSGAEQRAATSRLIPIASIEPHPDQPRRIFEEEALAELAASIAGARRDPADRRPSARPPLPDRRRRATLAGGTEGAAARDPRDRSRFQRRRNARDRADREYPAPGPQRDRGGAGLSSGWSRITATPRKSSAELVHKSRSHVANLLRLLDLPARVQAMVGSGELSMGHARALITASDPEVAGRRGGAPRPFGARGRAARPPRQGRRGNDRCRSSIRAPAPTSPRSSGSWATCSASR